MRLAIPACLVMLGACADPRPGGAKAPGDDTGTAPGTPPGTTDTETQPPTGDTGATPASTVPQVAFDCSTIPLGERPYVKHTWVPGSEDFTFSADGYMVNVSAGTLKRTPYGGPTEVLVPGLGDARGTRFLPDGRLVIAHIETGSIRVIDPATGSVEVLAGGLTNPNGIAIGADGRVYVATTGAIQRIDPDTKGVEVVADLPNNSFDGLTFSPDYRRLYFNEELGQVHWVDFDDQGNPGPPQGVVEIPNGASLLDGMAVDACGNLYVLVMNGKVWRIWPDSTQELVADVASLVFVPALNFGLPATGGWGNLDLYVNDFVGSVYEIDLGVPGKWEPHLPVP